jgi:hypothetical protein
MIRFSELAYHIVQLSFISYNILYVKKKLVAFCSSLEVVSKPQIRFKGKAQADRESAAYMGM